MVENISQWLMTILMVIFFLGLVFKILIYFTIRTEHKFALLFEENTQKFLEDIERGDNDLITLNSNLVAKQEGVSNTMKENLLNEKYASFLQIVKYLLDKTEHSFTEKTTKLHQRLKVLRYLGVRLKYTPAEVSLITGQAREQLLTSEEAIDCSVEKAQAPNFLQIAKYTFEHYNLNSKIAGILPTIICNRHLNLLPTLFIISGALGTFVNILNLPLEMEKANITAWFENKEILHLFFMQVGTAVYSTIWGIILAVGTIIISAATSTELIYFRSVNNFARSLEIIWRHPVKDSILTSAISSNEIEPQIKMINKNIKATDDKQQNFNEDKFENEFSYGIMSAANMISSIGGSDDPPELPEIPEIPEVALVESVGE